MGGLAGIKYWNDASCVDGKLIFKMIAELQHRGPDYKIECLEEKGAFGIRYQKSNKDIEEFANDSLRKLWVLLQ